MPNGALRFTVTAQLNRGLLFAYCKDKQKLLAMAFAEWKKRNPTALSVTLANFSGKMLGATLDTLQITVSEDNQEMRFCRIKRNPGSYVKLSW